MGDAKAMRLRLNEVVRAINEAPKRWRTFRIPQIFNQEYVSIPRTEFVVGAIVVGGVQPLNNSTAPSAAPWCGFNQLPDGSITVVIYGLGSRPNLYAINLILCEADGAS